MCTQELKTKLDGGRDVRDKMRLKVAPIENDIILGKPGRTKHNLHIDWQHHIVQLQRNGKAIKLQGAIHYPRRGKGAEYSDHLSSAIEKVKS